jgi:hypothetical protein
MRNITTMEQFKRVVDINYGIVLDYKLNSNNGTIAYDSSSNVNHGTISGATWNNDGVLVTLVNGVDYTLNTASGLLTLSASYLYDYVSSSWSYYENVNSNASVVAHLIELFVALAMIFFVYLIIKANLQED